MAGAMFDKFGNLLVAGGPGGSVGGGPDVALPAGWDSGWVAAKAASATAARWITQIGDSVGQGQVATDTLALGYFGVLRGILGGRGLPLMGDFYSVMDSADYMAATGATFNGTPPFVVTSTGRTWYSWGLGRLPFYSAGNGTVTFTCPYACTELDVVFFDQTAGTFTYNLDGAGAVTVVPNCTGVHYSRRLQLTGLSNIAHSIVFTSQSTGNVMCVQGVATYPTAAARSAGIGYGRCAYNAAAVADFANTGNQPPDMAKQWQGFGAATTGFGFPTQPALLIIEEGINDLQQLYGLAQFRRGLERLIQAARRGYPGCSVILLGVSNPDGLSSDVTSGNFSNAVGWGAYLAVMAEVALEYKCAFVNIHERWGSTGVAQGFQAATQPHPTNAGHADIAGLLASIL
jgi:GDSL-like Lipase/Acylhydrolase family